VEKSVTGCSHQAPSIKVCGLTRPADVTLAAELGAWAVGFVFAPSPRQVTVEQARPLVAAARAAHRGGAARGPASRSPLTVGVFVDATAEEVAATAYAAGLDAVQLHGPEPGARAVREALGHLARDILIIQAVAVPAAGTAAADLRAAVIAAEEGAGMLLFDTRSGDRFGGSGTPFPWAIAREAAAGAPFLVAGGIGPQNVREALETSGAAGVDVSSGVEVSPGVKDAGLLRALFMAAGGRGAPGTGGPCIPPSAGRGRRAARPPIDRELSEGRKL
jgi:phosphoribosylanthranilate isomerase